MADLTEQIKELMKKPEKIRNIGVCAHIDHGKCVSGDSRVFLDNGSFVKAEDLFLKYENKGKIIKNDNEKIIDVRDQNIKIPSFNKKTCKIEESNLSFIWKINTAENLVELEFHDGKKVKTTPEHKFLTINQNYEIIEKRSYELDNNDFIISPRNLKYNSISLKELELIFIKELSKDSGFLIYLNEDYKYYLHKKIIDYGREKIWKEINSDLKFLSFYHRIWKGKGRYRICDIIKIFDLLKIPLSDLYKNISHINYRKSLKKEFKTSVSINLPKNEKDWKNFFYLLGLIWGDGDVNIFIHNNDKQIHNEIKRICKEVFGVDITLRISKTKCPRIDLKLGLTFTKILTNLFNYSLKDKSGNINFPNLIQKLPKNLISNFISGYFDADGSVGFKHVISTSSKSKQFIEELQLILLRFGCLSTIFKKDVYLKGKVFPQWVLNINGCLSTKNFKEKIGFNLQIKKENLDKFLLNSQLSKKFDYLPYGKFKVSSNKKSHLQLEHNNLLIKQFLQQEIYFNQLKNKKEIENLDGYVFDFSVYGNENFIADGLIIHNTTFSDNLLLGAGMMSEELAGKQLVLDFHEDEKERGITIDSANVSMVHKVGDEDFLINLIDTPGHVDFGGDVTRAMRAVDGAIVLCCAVEGIMPQTETVLKQALRERVKPILFINKVDRLIKEVKLTPEKMQERFIKIINNINELIKNIAPEEYKEKWQVSVQDGSVAFGSAFHKWALSFPYMKKTNITFKDVIEAYEKENHQELSKKAPVHKVILDIVTQHHPNPLEAQKYRIPKIWHGDIEDEVGKSLMNCDPKGPVAFIVTKIVVDKHAGEVSAGRLFSGTLRQGEEIYMNLAKRKLRIQQISIYKGPTRLQVNEAPAGNIVGITGLKDTFAGETISSYPIEPFEAIKHIFEPVVTKSIEAKRSADLPKLVEVLKQVSKEDPSIFIEINEETGENLMSGMGELHLEVIENRIIKEKGLQVNTSDPIVVYRETVQKISQEVEGKSPNKHNKFFFTVEPLSEEVYKAIKAGEIPEMRVKKKDSALWEKFVKLGMDAKEARKVKDIFKGCLLVDSTRGVVHIGEVIEMITDAFQQVIKEGPVAREPSIKVRVNIMDCKLHEDAIHRGPAQVLPAVRDAIKEAMKNAKATLFEPLQILQIDAPLDYMGEISKLIQNKRGSVLNMDQTGTMIVVKAKLPVAEMFGLTSDLRSATGGRGSHYVVDQVFEKVPESLQEKVIKQIRKRKGLSENA
ncbi:MAG: elongation factor EF-2 [Nanoarchaeota archaeon]|nr:elongation factor EF-2 [Nanoarchaeota archaeon]